MKIKSLLIGMLACTALVGCSDDVIQGMDNQEVQTNNSPAYLTVSFSTGGSSSRSTADDANNNGDTHNKDGEKGQEHSGHINVGSDAENAIYSALVVVHSTTNKTGYAKLYEFAKLQATTHGQEQHYTLAENIELTTATYDVLVVANPYASLYETYKNELSADNGTKTFTTVDALYKEILKGNYANGDENAIGGKGQNFAGDILSFDEDKTTLKSIMMANKSQCQVELKAGVDNYACVEIERVASKITFRPTDNGNVFEVKVPDLSTVVMHTLTVGETTYNKATLGENTYWVVVTAGNDADAESYAYYTYTSDNQTEFALVSDALTGTPEWVYKEGEIKKNTWTVKLEEYALVNLSKKVYNVRHTINAGSTAVPFGKLTGNNFLYTPNWEADFNGGINNVEFENGNFKKTDFTTSPWFYNTLANVSADSKSSREIYFATLPESYNASTDDDDVTEDGEEHYTEGNDKTPAIGNLLAYCLENTTDILHQTHGLSTGITFVGKIYDENGDKISTLYRYNGYLFQSIAAIKKAYDIKDSDKDWLSINEESDADALAKVNVVKYDSNTCYYYSTEIKHFDNSLPTQLGNMEFAIMRNNIYSLSVSGVNVIGDPWVDPIPSTPDEVEKPKLEVHAKIMPWIVRYHDIEFN